MNIKSSLLAAPAVLVMLGGAACTPSNTEGPTLTGTTWELQQIQLNDGQQFVADPPQNYTAEFSENGELFVQADCNQASGSYTVENENLISITAEASTLAACPEGSISEEYLRFLNNANSFFFQDGDLIIEIKFDSGSLQFSPAG